MNLTESSHICDSEAEVCDSEVCDSEVCDSEVCDSEVCDSEDCDSEVCDSEVSPGLGGGAGELQKGSPVSGTGVLVSACSRRRGDPMLC